MTSCTVSARLDRKFVLALLLVAASYTLLVTVDVRADLHSGQATSLASVGDGAGGTDW